MADGWTIPDAAAELAKTGIPFDGLDRIISSLPGFLPCGERKKPAGSKGGRGYKLYAIEDIQHLHGFLARKGWLTPPASGDA